MARSSHSEAALLPRRSRHLQDPNSSRHFPDFDNVRRRFETGRDALSEDEEHSLGRPRLPKPIHVRGNSADSTFDHDFAPPPLPYRPTTPRKPRMKSPGKPRAMTPSKAIKQVDLGGSEELHLTEHEINSFLHPTLNDLRKSVKLKTVESATEDVSSAIYKAVVGYLGTIEMPKRNVE